MSEKIPKDVIFVGNKPLANYIMASMMQLRSGGRAILKARGRAINRAVDVVELLKSRFGFSGTETVKIGSEMVEVKEENRKLRISTIEINLREKNKYQ